MSDLQNAFLDSASVARRLIASPEVKSGWSQASALPEMSVGALSAHLARAAFTVETYLNAPAPSGDQVVTAAAYLLQAVSSNGWSDLHSPLNAGIRQRALNDSQSGHEELVTRLDRTLEHLITALAQERDDRLVEVFNGLTMRLDQYLQTRIVELAIHADDLAVSVGLVAPALPPVALRVSIDLLVNVAVTRHGSIAVLRALSRQERDTVHALQVL